MKHFLLLLIIISIPSPALAIAAEPLSMGSGLLRTAWALLVVIGLILCIYGLLRKRFGLGNLAQGNIKILEIKHIVPKNSIALVEVNNRQFLLGVSSGQVNLLADFGDKEDREKGVIKKTENDSPDFKTILAGEQ